MTPTADLTFFLARAPFAFELALTRFFDGSGVSLLPVFPLLASSSPSSESFLGNFLVPRCSCLPSQTVRLFFLPPHRAIWCSVMM